MAIQFQHLEQWGGVTRLAGHRMRVLDVANSRASGLSPEEIAGQYHLPLGAVYEALAYASDHSEGVGCLRQTEDEILDRLGTANQQPYGPDIPR